MGPYEERLARLAHAADRYQVPLACILSMAVLLVLQQVHHIRGLPYDAGFYWLLADIKTFGTVKTIRGYFFPALLLPLRYLCDLTPDPLATLRIGLAIIYGLLLPTLVPAAFHRAFGGRMSLWRRLVPVLLMAQLFPGLLLYPLSDLPALLMAMAALLCVLAAADSERSRRTCLALLGAAGALAGATYNTRTIYIFAVLGMVLLLLYIATRNTGSSAVMRTKWLGIASFTAGLVLVSLPQIPFNQRFQGVASLAVVTQENKRSLFSSQLVWGMTVQRYETNISGPQYEGRASMYYLDHAGERLYKRLVAENPLFSVMDYFKAVARYPLDFLALYTRHVLNGLDLRDGIVYTEKPSASRNRTALFNFCVLALAAWVAFSIRSQSRPGGTGAVRPAPATWPLSLCVLLLPVAAIVPGAIETRFFVPLHLLAYCVIAFHFDAGTLSRSFTRHRGALVTAFVLAFCAFFAVTVSTMATMQHMATISMVW